MNPSDLYSLILSTLTNARAQMLTPAYQSSAELADPGVRLKASQTLIDVQQAILSLSNASLSDIASAMQANSTALTTAISDLNTALKQVTQVLSILDDATTLLKIVAKIVPFV